MVTRERQSFLWFRPSLVMVFENQSVQRMEQQSNIFLTFVGPISLLCSILTEEHLS